LGAVGLVDNIVIGVGDFTNYSAYANPPKTRQMPYHDGVPTLFPHQLDFPPNRFVACTDLISGLPLVLAPGDILPFDMAFDPSLPGVPFEPNGDLAGVIYQTDGTAEDL